MNDTSNLLLNKIKEELPNDLVIHIIQYLPNKDKTDNYFNRKIKNLLLSLIIFIINCYIIGSFFTKQYLPLSIILINIFIGYMITVVLGSILIFQYIIFIKPMNI